MMSPRRALVPIFAWLVSTACGSATNEPASDPSGSSDASEGRGAPPEDATHTDAKAPASDASADAHDAADGPAAACQTVSDVFFRTRDAYVLKHPGGDDYEVVFGSRPASLQAPGSPVRGNVRISIYRGSRAGFSAKTFTIGCAVSGSCVESAIYDAKSGRTFGLATGQVSVTATATPMTHELAGDFTALEFRTLRTVTTSDGSVVQAIDPAGACMTVPAFGFDTRAAAGDACTDPDDCGATMACQPATLTCVASQCNGGAGTCASGTSCLAHGSQHFPEGGTAAGLTGVCTPSCSAAVTDVCPGALMCRRYIVGPPTCLGVGTATLGQACEGTMVTSGCIAGLTCSAATKTCVTACDHFAVHPGCPGGVRCNTRDECAPQSGAPDPASLDQACAGGSYGQPCGDDGASYRGVCVPNGFDPTAQPYCRRECYPSAGSPPCTNGTTCLGVNQTFACRPTF